MPVAETFKCGRLLVAQGINSRIADDLGFSKFIVNALNRHVSCDWGEMDEEDKQENDYALDKYLRLFSAYELNDQEKSVAVQVVRDIQEEIKALVEKENPEAVQQLG